MSGPNSKRTDVSLIIRVRRGPASMVLTVFTRVYVSRPANAWCSAWVRKLCLSVSASGAEAAVKRGLNKKAEPLKAASGCLNENLRAPTCDGGRLTAPQLPGRPMQTWTAQE